MAIGSIGSSTAASAAQAELLKAQQKLAIDTAAKAAEKVITADKAAVTKSQQEVTQQQSSTRSGSIDITL